MTSSESIAEVFLIAFKSLPKEEKDAVILQIIRDKEIREDLQDLLCFEEQQNEPTTPFRDYLAQRKA